METTLFAAMALIFVLGMWWKLDHDKKKSDRVKTVHPQRH
jgi:hypothetical protein